MKIALVTSALLVTSGLLAFGAPPWVTSLEGQTRSGSILDLTCIGTGPSLDLARRSARESCQSTASDHLSSFIEIRSVSVETEKDVALHQEVIEERKITGLECRLKKETVEEIGGQFKVYQRCQYDLSRTSVKASNNRIRKRSLQIDPKLGVLKGAAKASQSGRHLASATRRILIAVVPACDELVIESEQPRIVRCAGRNPQEVLVHPGDRRVIVRARGFLPKTIELTAEEGGSEYDEEPIQVLLERAR